MISAMILAAGESKRMGTPKMLLRWGESPVLGHVISTFIQAGIEDVLVVTGGAREQVEEIVKQHGGRSVFNEEYSQCEMLGSLQKGLQAQLPQTQATFVALKEKGQLTSPDDAAARVLAYLDRADFGANPVADVREP